MLSVDYKEAVSMVRHKIGSSQFTSYINGELKHSILTMKPQLTLHLLGFLLFYNMLFKKVNRL